MAFIHYLDPDDLEADEQVPDRDNILRVHSVNPRVMRLHYEMYQGLMHAPGPLSRVQREMIAVVVSATNGCHY